ncbi:MAG: hypothetical protein M1828_003873 [Chrysothrix sp. TS-e1954]|nr:MAG: hypothetical protein M1828_003873 [Chrysothrix sp. TS-e1954]
MATTISPDQPLSQHADRGTSNTGLPLRFIVTSHPEEIKKRSIMRQIRSHAILDHLEKSGPRKPRGPPVRRTQGARQLGDSSSVSGAVKPTNRPNRKRRPKNMLERDVRPVSGASSINHNSNQIVVRNRSILPADPYRITGSPIDPFHTLPQFTDPLLQVEELAYHCLGFVGTVGKSPTWVKTILSDRLAYLSSLAIEAVRQDIVQNITGKSKKTLVVEGDVVSLIKSKIMEPATACSDETIFGVLHLLTGQIIQGDISLLDTHVRGLESIVLQRGGLKNLGLKNEVANIIAKKVMIKCIMYEQEPHPMHSSFDLPYPIWMQSFSEKTPESPLYWEDTDLHMFNLAENCTTQTLAILRDMRALSTQVLSTSTQCHSDDPGLSNVNKLRAWPSEAPYLTTSNIDPIDIEQRCFSRHAVNAAEGLTDKDWVYEAIRLTSLIYSTALVNRCPFSIAHDIASTKLGVTSIARLLVRAVQMTDSARLWQDMSGCFFWVMITGAASASGHYGQFARQVQTPADIICRKMLSLNCIRCMQMLACEHSDMISTSCRNMLAVQKSLADAWEMKSQPDVTFNDVDVASMAQNIEKDVAFDNENATDLWPEAMGPTVDVPPVIDPSLINMPDALAVP